MKLTYYGHASFAVTINGKHILFDPYISPNSQAASINIDTLPADYILLSHGHGDHVADVAAIAKRTGAKLVGAAEVMGWFQQQGLDNVHPMNYGSFEFDFGRVSFVPAWHSSGMPDGSYGGNPGGFVIRSSEGNFYYSGDTCLMLDMQLVPHYARLDYAILPIGGNYTMDAEDAVKASDFIQCSKIVGVHYNTFPPIVIDTAKAKELFRLADKELILPAIGETIDI
jgi:L-ascorbate metabolism protein UlaG (beta-lactamase superfamily)